MLCVCVGGGGGGPIGSSCMAVVGHYEKKRSACVKCEVNSEIKKGTECMRSLGPPRYGVTRCPQPRMFCVGESWCRRAYKQVPTVSALDIATDLKSAERRIADGRLPPLPLTMRQTLVRYVQKPSAIRLHSRLQRSPQTS